MFQTIKFRLGVHATIPFYVDMVRNKNIDKLGKDLMVIEASQLTPVQLIIRELCNRIELVIKANGGVPTSIGIDLRKIWNDMILVAANEVAVSQRTIADITEHLMMLLAENVITPDLLIEAARGTVFYNDLVIATSNLTPVQYAIAAMCDELKAMLVAHGNVSTDLHIAFDEVRNNLVLAAADNLETSIGVDANIVEQIAMIIEAYETEPTIAIEMAKDAVIQNNLVLHAANGVQTLPTIEIAEANNDLIIRTDNGIEIGPIAQSLDQISNTMEFNLSKRLMKITHWDPEILGETDSWTLGRMIDIPFEVALDIALVEDGEGNLQMVLKAKDNTGTVVSHPIVIGTLDLKKIGELDPDTIPDATTEET